jgi:MHS family proline/betaine transporter-like MFS transporter
MKDSHSLTKEQKEAIGLLSIGTFLEYFDLMLYVHMAVLLNELFFPKTDPYTASLLSAFAFCSTYLLRPFGALIFGWIGDNIGRKAVVIITTLMMAVSCAIMAIVPTYAEIGITASWVITFCRMMQGMSSMGEVVGAEIYLTESIKPPARYPAVALITIFCVLGGVFALGIVTLLNTMNLSWRLAFYFGAGIALVGFIARTALKETTDFADAQRRIKETLKHNAQNADFLNSNIIWQEQINKKTLISFLFMQCAWPITFYFAFIYCGNTLKNSFGFSASQIIEHNFVISLIQLSAFSIFALLSYKIHPLKILKARLWGFFVFVLICPYLFANLRNASDLMIIQSIILVFSSTDIPAAPIIYIHFPIFKRFSYITMIYAISRLIMYTVGSFGMIYLVEKFDNWGFFIIMLPISLGLTFAISHFEELEWISETLHQKKARTP